MQAGSMIALYSDTAIWKAIATVTKLKLPVQHYSSTEQLANSMLRLQRCCHTWNSIFLATN